MTNDKKDGQNMIKLEASFKIVTPLFMSGVGQEEAELRAASFRGVLRFWWRALALGHNNGSWEAVRKAEFDLFGSSSRGQSRVHLSLSAPRQPEMRRNKGSMMKDGSGKDLDKGGRYLGYGVIDANGAAVRPYLMAPLEFDLKIYLRSSCITPSSSESLSGEAELLEGALKAMGLLGGLGSRSRRGFGSLVLLELKRDGVSRYKAAQNVDDYVSSLKDFLRKYVRADETRTLPDYTAFCQDTRIYLLETGEDPLKLLGTIGQKMLEYRSWTAEKNFLDDHNNMRDALFDPALAYPRRVAFGLPHNYYFSSQEHKLSKPVVEVVPDKYDQGHDRRASPLILHVQEISKGRYASVATVFPSIFLPIGEGILIKRAKQNQMEIEQNVPRKILFAKRDWYKELFDFLESKDPDNPGKMRFDRLEVLRPEVSAMRSA